VLTVPYVFRALSRGIGFSSWCSRFNCRLTIINQERLVWRFSDIIIPRKKSLHGGTFHACDASVHPNSAAATLNPRVAFQTRTGFLPCVIRFRTVLHWQMRSAKLSGNDDGRLSRR